MSIKGYQKTVLDNGFQVHSHKIPGAKKAYVEVRAKAGSDHEKPGITGVAHYLEHMLGYGSNRYQEHDLIPFFKKQGGYVNFTTMRNRTFYWRYALPHKIPDFLERISDVLLNPAFTREHVELERTPILDEQSKDFADIDSKILREEGKRVFPDHKISIPVIGHQGDIENMTYEDLIEFYETQYVASNMMLVAAGDIDHDFMVRLADQYFGAMPLKSEPLRPPKVICRKGNHYSESDYGFTQFSLGFNVADDQRNEIIEAVIRDKISEELRDKRKLLYGASTELANMGYLSMFRIYSSINPKLLPKAIDGIYDVLQTCATGLTQRDLEILVNEKEEEIAEFATVPITVGQRLANTVQLYGHYVPYERDMKELNALTPEGIETMVRSMLSRDPFLFVVGPVEEIPDILEKSSKLRADLGIERQRSVGLSNQFG